MTKGGAVRKTTALTEKAVNLRLEYEGIDAKGTDECSTF